jgi:hypothetical protein
MPVTFYQGKWSEEFPEMNCPVCENAAAEEGASHVGLMCTVAFKTADRHSGHSLPLGEIIIGRRFSAHKRGDKLC